MDVVYNQGSTLTIILDNRITAMTGHQDNPGTGYTLGEPTVALEIGPICKALGVNVSAKLILMIYRLGSGH